jgi:hypothetical protein
MVHEFHLEGIKVVVELRVRLLTELEDHGKFDWF